MILFIINTISPHDAEKYVMAWGGLKMQTVGDCKLSGEDMAESSNSAYQRIWQTTLNIPVGKVVSYGQLADLAGLPGRARLAGKALGYAPASLTLPWHRVLRANGQLAFPKGSEQALLQTGLLQEEGVVVLNHRVRMNDFQWQPNLSELLHDLTY
jgi:methylated-DNA-protein-cysteine methyltransferase related protein